MSGDEINILALSLSKAMATQCNKKELDDIVFLLKQITTLLMPYIIYDKND